MHFREASGADIPAIMSIRLAVKENRLSDPGRVTTRMYEDYLYKLGRGWVCEQGGAIIGFSYADSTDGSIWALFVLPECEGRGAGNGLLQLAVDWLFAQGWDELKLGTAAGTRADRFYATQGWRRDAMKNEIEVWYRLRRPALL
ncbi:MAG TPA: GNAT family N-acetyltransferase [Burkholderiaceae bacterium]